MTPKSHVISYKGEMPITVSIVEDDAQTRKILASWISRTQGFCLAGEWGEAESALPGLIEQKPDVVLMDINLPGISGVEAVKKLKPSLPQTQFVMLTVYEDSDHIYDALAAGATGYLLKQTPRPELVRALEDVHRGGSPMTSNIARKVVQSFRQKPAAPENGEELSPREQEVLDLLARGYLYKEIADRLNISVPTVNTYVRRMYEKLHVRSRAQAVAKYAHLVPGHGGRAKS
ncbi:MAG TPA: response regulator transcription factor [Candidatus Limnocylindrales bacterium]|jgi:DNA-binding NarL/FixJ family response regulator|nr:response regulator transcription factor [Candidatus Limnocylindrales bacterium]